MNRSSFFFILCFLSLSLSAQTRNYHVLLGSKKVGSVQATRTTVGDTTSYLTDFKIRIRLIKLYDIRSVTSAVYEDSVMQSSSMLVYDGGELDEAKNIVKENFSYRCIDCDDTPIVSDQLIYTNVSKVYFVEPIVRQDVYTERYLGFGKMTSLGDHKYKYEMPNGDENLYNYKDGMVESIEVHRFLYDLTFKYVD